MKFPILEKMQQDLEKLQRELRVDVPRELQKAAAYGDLSENAEYDAAKERKAFLESRIAQLIKRISAISSINIDLLPTDRAGFGSKIHLEDIDSGEEEVYRLVSSEEVDADKGLISIASPLGKALLGKQPGDDVEINLPSGRREYEVTKLLTIHNL